MSVIYEYILFVGCENLYVSRSLMYVRVVYTTLSCLFMLCCFVNKLYYVNNTCITIFHISLNAKVLGILYSDFPEYFLSNSWPFLLSPENIFFKILKLFILNVLMYFKLFLCFRWFLFCFLCFCFKTKVWWFCLYILILIDSSIYLYKNKKILNKLLNLWNEVESSKNYTKLEFEYSNKVHGF